MKERITCTSYVEPTTAAADTAAGFVFRAKIPSFEQSASKRKSFRAIQPSKFEMPVLGCIDQSMRRSVRSNEAKNEEYSISFPAQHDVSLRAFQLLNFVQFLW